MEIGALAAHEFPWMEQHSFETAWEQLTPAQQAATSPSVVQAMVQAMLKQGLSGPGGAAFVAREQGQPLGYLVVTAMPEELTGNLSGLFLDVWVDPLWRGRGVASLLDAVGEAHLRSLGLHQVRRVIAVHNGPSLRHALKDGSVVERLILVKDI